MTSNYPYDHLKGFHGPASHPNYDVHMSLDPYTGAHLQTSHRQHQPDTHGAQNNRMLKKLLLDRVADVQQQTLTNAGSRLASSLQEMKDFF